MTISQKEMDKRDKQLGAMSIPHCELEKWHYQALKHPSYQIEGVMDVIREEISMQNADSFWWHWDEDMRTELAGVSYNGQSAIRTVDSRTTDEQDKDRAGKTIVYKVLGEDLSNLHKLLMDYIDKKFNSLKDKKVDKQYKYK